VADGKPLHLWPPLAAAVPTAAASAAAAAAAAAAPVQITAQQDEAMTTAHPQLLYQYQQVR
jgi:hypothetical protein